MAEEAHKVTLNVYDLSRGLARQLSASFLGKVIEGLYIYDDGFRLVLWFGRMLSPDIAKNLLGSDFAAELSRVTLQEQENGMSKKLMRLIKKVRENDPSYHPMCFLVRQGEQPREGFLLLRHLIEDQMGGSASYVDWILQLHRQIQQNA
ncbi:hypothetical protein F2Q69_00032249 [Brassica cretica]|uniref:Gelsolin-like domain-containing protein n=1 Tax=Brassica cretica TaxID=69181 RepID=A0A8S9S859_BRACR|nr:hypothetical protein F2Q69_00032249 [Brassica cretica]